MEAVWTGRLRGARIRRASPRDIPLVAHASCADPASAPDAVGCSWNELKPEGATALATPLELLTGLTTLDLKWVAAVA